VTVGAALWLVHNFRKLNSEMPIAQAYCLLLIAQYEGLSLKELADRADVGMATASRYVAELGKVGLKGKEGMALIDAVEDPMERRKKIIRLTPKGKTFVSKITGDIKNASL
jgi:DNA-binding MarR family transcriptional regulator